jgi:hypothetical protein
MWLDHFLGLQEHKLTFDSKCVCEHSLVFAFEIFASNLVTES